MAKIDVLGWLRRDRTPPGMGTPPPAPPPAASPAAAPAIADEEVPRYPPFRRGLPVAPVARLLADQQALCRELQDVLALTDEEYRDLLAPVLARFAAYVHLLPASDAHHHRGGGGLLRHALEVAVLAAKAARLKLFTNDQDRYRLEGRWQVAAAVAGLLHDLGKPVVDLAVIDASGQQEWNPYTSPLLTWAQTAGVERYYLRWREGRRHNAHEAAGNLVLRHVLTPELETWLGADPALIGAMIAAIGGNPHTVLSALVREADARSVQQDLREERLDPLAVGVGVPVDRHLIDAMRRLVASGGWTVNQPGARLWMLPDGLHVVWPQCGEDIWQELARDQVPGIPRSPETLADILVERGHVVTYSAEGREGRFYREITVAQDSKAVTLRMLLLDDPDIIYAGRMPPRVLQPLASVPPQQRTLAATHEVPVAQPDDAPQPAPVALAPPPSARQVGRQSEERPPDSAEALRTADGAAEPDLTGGAGPAPGAPPGPGTASPDATPTTGPPAPAAPGAAQAHRDWLARQHAAGAWLLERVDEFARELASRGGRLDDDGRHLWLRTPDLFSGDDPDSAKATRDLLWTAKLIAVQPESPFRRTRERAGATWVVLTPECSRHLRALLTAAVPSAPPRTAPTPAAPAASVPAPPPASPIPPAAPSVPARTVGPMRNGDARIADILNRVRNGDIPAECMPQGWFLAAASLERITAELGWASTSVLVRRLGYLGATVCEGGMLIPH